MVLMMKFTEKFEECVSFQSFQLTNTASVFPLLSQSNSSLQTLWHHHMLTVISLSMVINMPRQQNPNSFCLVAAMRSALCSRLSEDYREPWVTYSYASYVVVSCDISIQIFRWFISSFLLIEQKGPTFAATLLVIISWSCYVSKDPYETQFANVANYICKSCIR